MHGKQTKTTPKPSLTQVWQERNDKMKQDKQEEFNKETIYKCVNRVEKNQPGIMRYPSLAIAESCYLSFIEAEAYLGSLGKKVHGEKVVTKTWKI